LSSATVVTERGCVIPRDWRIMPDEWSLESRDSLTKMTEHQVSVTELIRRSLDSSFEAEDEVGNAKSIASWEAMAALAAHLDEEVLEAAIGLLHSEDPWHRARGADMNLARSLEFCLLSSIQIEMFGEQSPCQWTLTGEMKQLMASANCAQTNGRMSEIGLPLSSGFPMWIQTESVYV
jgi:hypothetical protein